MVDRALVKGKFGKKGAGKGKAGGVEAAASSAPGKGGPSTGASPMAVDHSEKDCYACGETGHIARNCPSSPGPKGKGKDNGGKGNGKSLAGKGGRPDHWPSWGQWRNMYPGPPQSQWKDWWKQGKGQPGSGGSGLQYHGKVNLFEQGQRLSALQGPQAPWQDGWDESAWSPPSSQEVLSSLFTHGSLFALVKKGLKPKLADGK